VQLVVAGKWLSLSDETSGFSSLHAADKGRVSFPPALFNMCGKLRKFIYEPYARVRDTSLISHGTLLRATMMLVVRAYLHERFVRGFYYLMRDLDLKLVFVLIAIDLAAGKHLEKI
jgi:hypothetical protein